MSDQFGGYGQPPQGQQPYGSPYKPPAQQMPPPYPPPGGIPGRKTRSGGMGLGGCLVGCLIAVGVLIFLGGGLTWYTYHWAKKNLLEKAPIAIQIPELSDAQQMALKTKLAPVAKAFENDTGEIVELTLTQDELNWLILNGMKNEPEIKQAFKAALDFPADGVLGFRVSLAAGPGTTPQQPTGPYINVQGKTELEITNKQIKIKLIEGQIGKWKPPQSLLQAMNESFSQQIQKDPQMQQIWERVQDAKIETGEIYLKLRALKLPEQTTK